jgi:predicted transcriptional regulator
MTTATSKTIVQDLLKRLPEQVTLREIAQRIEFVAAVRQGLEELDHGDSVALDEVRQELPSWIIK